MLKTMKYHSFNAYSSHRGVKATESEEETFKFLKMLQPRTETGLLL
jgi:hypothetical protein